MNGPPAPDPVLLLGRDAQDAASLLARESIACQVCPDLDALCEAINNDTGSVLATDESFARRDLGVLTQRLAMQPPWSDLPFIVLTRSGPGHRRALEELRLPDILGNVVFLERPLGVLGLISAVRSSMRARLRQRQIAVHLAEQISAGALRKSEAQFRNMADSVPALIWMTDTKGQVVFANLHHEFIFGRGVKSIIRQGWTSIVLSEDRDRYAATFSAAFRDRISFKIEIRVRAKTGRILWLLCEGVPRQDDGGRFHGYTSCSVDVTEARLASERLERLAERLRLARDAAEQASRAKSRFVAGISHELRTPLNGILGYAQLLRMEGGLNTAQSGRVDAMLEAGKHLLQVITGVLDLSKIDAEKIELQVIEVDVQALAAACLDLVRPAAAVKALALTVAVAPGTPRTLPADPTRLRQVLVNLLGNAVKFTASGKVELRLCPAMEGFGLRIEVADTGPGVPGDQRQRLFQDFERLDGAVASNIEGAGLGLALSARLAAVMGGRIGHDDNPGGGSVFWLELPLMPAGSTIQPTAAASAPPVAVPTDLRPAPPPSPLHVLVVDDVAMNRDIAASFLRVAGHKVTCAESGAEAIAAVASTDFDVVLMDVRMPKMDGLEATRRIRALAGPRGRVPIVALTAQAFADQIAECHDAGMDSHLAKPFDPETLLTAVQRAAAATRRPSDYNGSVPARAVAAMGPSNSTELPASASP